MTDSQILLNPPLLKGNNLLIIPFCLLLFIIGCAGTTPQGANLDEGIKLSEDFVANARKSVELARDAGASDYSPNQLAQAEQLLAKAEGFLNRRKAREAGDLAFLADTEAKIATALTQEAKAKIRGAKAKGEEIKLVLEARMDESAAAKARQAIAERMMLKAQKESEKTKDFSDKEIQKARTELAIAKVELMIGLADQAKASEYAKKTYTDAKTALQRAIDFLNAGNFQGAVNSAEEAEKYASNAYIEARAKIDSETLESLRARDKAIAILAKAEVSVQQAKDNAIVRDYAKDDLTKAESALKEADIAFKSGNYDNAESLAQQARLAASNAWAVAGAKERETKAKEAQEDIKANALDIITRLERLISQAGNLNALEFADEEYKGARDKLDKAKQAMVKNDYEEAASKAREGINLSSIALAISEAKSELKKKTEEIEKSITEEAGKIPETSIRKTKRGVIISMRGDLFGRDNKIKNDVQNRIKILADLIKNYSDYKFIIESHTDDKGSDEGNLKTTNERAQNFLRYLVEKEGVPLDMLSSVGYGESKPVVPNIDDESRKQNRRIDILILLPKSF